MRTPTLDRPHLQEYIYWICCRIVKLVRVHFDCHLYPFHSIQIYLIPILVNKLRWIITVNLKIIPYITINHFQNNKEVTKTPFNSSKMTQPLLKLPITPIITTTK